jgi:hypothetical protein
VDKVVQVISRVTDAEGSRWLQLAAGAQLDAPDERPRGRTRTASGATASSHASEGPSRRTSASGSIAAAGGFDETKGDGETEPPVLTQEPLWVQEMASDQLLLGRAEPLTSESIISVPKARGLSIAFDKKTTELWKGKDSVQVLNAQTRAPLTDVITETAQLPTPEQPLYIAGSSAMIVFHQEAAETWGYRAAAHPIDSKTFPWLTYMSGPHRLIESTHNYADNEDVYTTVRIEGADHLAVVFDARSQTENNYDYCRFYKDESHSEWWGAEKYTGLDFPGVRGAEPLVIESDSVVFHFHSDGSKNEWGYRFLVFDAKYMFADEEEEEEEGTLSSTGGSRSRSAPFVYPFFENHTPHPQTICVDMPIKKGVAYYEIYCTQNSSPYSFIQAGWSIRNSLIKCPPDLRAMDRKDRELPMSLGLGSTRDSWGVDGVMRPDYRESQKYYDGKATAYKNSLWKAGSVVGCLLDMDSATISYSLNGRDLGTAFSLRDYSAAKWRCGLTPAFSLSPGQSLHLNLGGKTPFLYGPSVDSGIKWGSVGNHYSLSATGAALLWEPTFNIWEEINSDSGVWEAVKDTLVPRFCSVSKALVQDLISRVSSRELKAELEGIVRSVQVPGPPPRRECLHELPWLELRFICWANAVFSFVAQSSTSWVLP